MTNTRYVIRNNYSGTYIHKTLFKIIAFQTKTDALRYMRTHRLNERYYKVVEVR